MPLDGPRVRWRLPRRRLELYVFALLATGLAGMAREALTPLLGAKYPFTTFYIAVAVGSWFGGFGPGLCSTLTGASSACLLWSAPAWRIGAEEPGNLVGLVLFVISGVAIAVGNESLRRSFARERTARAEAQAARADAEAARARAEVAAVARENVQAIVAHDLRSPLGVVTMQAAMLERCAIVGPEGEDIRRRGAMMMRAAAQMSTLIRDLLDAASIEADQLSVEPKRGEVHVAVSEAIELATPLATAKGLVLEEVVPEGIPFVCWDHDRVLQLLGNLIGNAIKFTPAGGRICVEASADDAWIRVSVADTGPGIPADQLPHVFERFWKSKRSAGGGTGLGLFIAGGIARAHGGSIEVRSAPGEGTTFLVRLPRTART